MVSLRLRLNWKCIMRIGLVLIIAFPVVMALNLIFMINEPIFNPPYADFILQATFVLGTSLAVAYISAKGYLNSGQRNLVFLGSALLVNGIITTISVIPLGLSSNIIVTMANLGTMTSAILQFSGAIITFTGSAPRETVNRKAIIATAYTTSILLVGLAIGLAFSNWLPVFLTPTGPTSLRLAIIGVTIVLLFASSLLFTWRYFKVKSPILYWYSLALILYGLALVAAFFTMGLGDLMNWISRLAIYLSGVYFLLAILSLRNEAKQGVSLSEKWAQTFRSQQQLSALFANMLNGFTYNKILTDKTGKPVDYVFIDVNNAFEKMTGLKRDKIIGKRVTDVIPGAEKEDWIETYGKVAIAGKPIVFESYSKQLDKCFNISAYSTQKSYFVALFEDITERKKAEQEIAQGKQRLEAHMNNSPEAVIEFDPQFRVIRWSEEAKRVFGWLPEEIIGRSIAEMPWVYEEDVESVQQVSTDMLSGKRPRNVNSNRNYRKDGSVIYCEWYNSAIYDANGKLTSVLSQVVDVTERRQMQLRLQEYANNLERLVEDRTKQLKDSERLAAIGQTAGMVGHDIRNPLQAITSDLYLLNEEVKGMPKSEGRKSMEESIGSIGENIVYINKIVSDLQDYTRPLKPNVEKVNLKDLINSTLIITNIPENIQAQVNVKANLSLKVDAAYLRRVLTNLIVNAIQAMPKGGELTVKAISKNDRVIVSVEDTGVGIPEQVKPNLFKPLYTTKSKGQGLGLAVVKRFVEGLNGKISFESEEGKGTKFSIDLPASNKDSSS